MQQAGGRGWPHASHASHATHGPSGPSGPSGPHGPHGPHVTGAMLYEAPAPLLPCCPQPCAPYRYEPKYLPPYQYYAPYRQRQPELAQRYYPQLQYQYQYQYQYQEPKQPAPYKLKHAADPYRVAQLAPGPVPVPVPDAAKYKMDYYNHHYRGAAAAAYPSVQYPTEVNPYAGYPTDASNCEYAKPSNGYYSGNNIYHHQKQPEYQQYDRGCEWDIAEYQRYYRSSKPSSYNPLARIPTEFSPNVISPTESGGSFESVATGSCQPYQEDGGYASQCSTVSRQSAEFRPTVRREPRPEFNYPRQYYQSPAVPPPPERIELERPPDKPTIDLRRYFEMWDEEDDDARVVNDDVREPPKAKVQPQQYLTNANPYAASRSAPVAYPPCERLQRLPDYSEIPISNPPMSNAQYYPQPIAKREPPIERFVEKIPKADFYVNEFIDVEAKISQSVIHKEVGCNFEIKPCSPRDRAEVAAPPTAANVNFVRSTETNQPLRPVRQPNKSYVERENFSKNLPKNYPANVYEHPYRGAVVPGEASVICKSAKIVPFSESNVEYERKINKESRICGSVFINKYDSREAYGTQVENVNAILPQIPDEPNAKYLYATKSIPPKRKRELYHSSPAEEIIDRAPTIEKKMRPAEIVESPNVPQFLPDLNENRSHLSLPEIISTEVEKNDSFPNYIRPLDNRDPVILDIANCSYAAPSNYFERPTLDCETERSKTASVIKNSTVETLPIAVVIDSSDDMVKSDDVPKIMSPENILNSNVADIASELNLETKYEELDDISSNVPDDIPVLSKSSFEDESEMGSDAREKLKLLDKLENPQLCDRDVPIDLMMKSDIELQIDGDVVTLKLMDDQMPSEALDYTEESVDEIKLNEEYLTNDNANIVMFAEYDEGCLIVESNIEDESDGKNEGNRNFVNKSVIMSTGDTIEDCLLNAPDDASGSPVIDDEPPSANINLNYNTEKLFEIDMSYPLNEDVGLTNENDIFPDIMEPPCKDNNKIPDEKYDVENDKYESQESNSQCSSDSTSDSAIKPSMSSSSQNSDTSSTYGDEPMSPDYRDNSDVEVNGLEIAGCWIDDIARNETVESGINDDDDSDDYVNSSQLWESTVTQEEYPDSSDNDEILTDSNRNIIPHSVNGKRGFHPDSDELRDTFKYFNEQSTENNSTEILYNKSYAELEKQIDKEKQEEENAMKHSKNDDVDANLICDSPAINLSAGRIKTKGAQKYIPPIESTNHRLKCHLPLPKNKLLLKKLTIDSRRKKDDEKLHGTPDDRRNNRMRLPKKAKKPLFEDVLRNIDETNMSMIKSKLKTKRHKNAIPKMIIKRDNTGSHYTSVSTKTDDDGGGDKVSNRWQPQVCLQRSACIEDMVKVKK